MTYATFFPTRWPASTYGPGLHNYEIHTEQSSCAHGWSAARAALHLQTLYSHLSSDGADDRSFIHYDGNVYSLGEGVPLPCFLDRIEAKYRDVTVLTIWFNDRRGIVDVDVLKGQCAEALVPGSQNRGFATQFSWAFRWMFAKCLRGRIGREYGRLLSDLD
ncbi:hypothetical protein BU25DRAFT_480822 [Macroventuria anomochaeta]|uniref:Uncharacterized protein n=1 Tax=Macroventuria anomochaeta TaxID=301207 RepID=A0ACB6RK64_9PLEO|nr:uncharacterized protein BU25DRAFT_480822 [Macroventuria anomochaeta]KAF2622261.1 hypothetical protein BU25DRAFT_480822 [Macroventuria anomochaeta]